MAHPNEESLDRLKKMLAIMETGEPDARQVQALRSQITRLEKEAITKDTAQQRFRNELAEENIK